MNIAVTSKEALLEAAKAIAYHEGLEKLNIRRVADSCGISVGAVYNYFPAKADLVFALVEDFWCHIAGGQACPVSPQNGFFGYFEQLYLSLHLKLKDFETAFLRQIALFSDAEKEKGRAIESVYWAHMRAGLLKALDQDPLIAPAVWNEIFTREALADFAFSALMAQLRSGQADCSFLKEVFARLLYQQQVPPYFLQKRRNFNANY